MVGRLGTSVDVIFSAGALNAVLERTDSVIEDDVRVGMFLKGILASDPKGEFYEVDGIVPERAGAVGLCITSSEEGTEAAESDVLMFRESFDRGVLMIVDPYACEFAVYKVGADAVEKASMIVKN